MLKYIRKIVMAFTAKHLATTNQQQAIPVDNSLTLEELAILLNTLKDADLKGHQVETFYNLIIKVQNQYIEKQGK